MHYTAEKSFFFGIVFSASLLFQLWFRIAQRVEDLDLVDFQYWQDFWPRRNGKSVNMRGANKSAFSSCEAAAEIQLGQRSK